METMSNTTVIKKKIEQHLPGAKVNVENYTPAHVWHKPNGEYLSITIIYAGFHGKSRIEQHQIIYQILKEEMKKKIHALELKTREE